MNTTLKIDFNQFLQAISLATDLTQSSLFSDEKLKLNLKAPIPDFNASKHNFLNHSRRTALVCSYIGKALNLDEKARTNLYISSYLHDIGAIEAFGISHTDDDFIEEHCVSGAEIISHFPIDSPIPDFIRYHHENYDGSGMNGLRGANIPIETMIIHAGDTFELLYQDHIPNRYQRKNIMETMKKMSGTIFSPMVIDALTYSSNCEKFWLDIENINIDLGILEHFQHNLQKTISLDQLESMSKSFAILIDKKSSYTHNHSLGVTEVATSISRHLRLSERKVYLIRIAALLHDIGKLSTPGYLLDKPGKLDNDEMTVMKSHVYYTKMILNKLKDIPELSVWAANHHETLNGTGYPEGLKSDQLSKECRIIAVSDIYHALIEDRPYRKGMTKTAAFSILDDLVFKGSIDSKIVSVLKKIS